MEINVIKHTGESTKKKINISSFFADYKPSDHAIYLDVKRIMASFRQGTHKSKEKGEIKGSTRKLRKQKGTGNARVGSIKSPIFKGGGRIFGPKPRTYDFKVNKKTIKIAQRSALYYKIREESLIFLEDFNINSSKTKEYIQIIKNLKLDNIKSLLITNTFKKDLYLSVRNIKNAKVIESKYLNTYDIIKYDKIIFLEKAFEEFEKKLKLNHKKV